MTKPEPGTPEHREYIRDVLRGLRTGMSRTAGKVLEKEITRLWRELDKEGAKDE